MLSTMPKRESQYAGHLMSKHRIEQLDDGVFAIVMTILVLELKVPWDVPEHLLATTIIDQWPVLLAYIASFINLGIFWIGQHYQFHYLRHVDRILLWINIFFLMAVALIPFTTSLLGAHRHSHIPSLLYGLNLILIGLLTTVHWDYAVRHALTNEQFTPAKNQHVRRRLLVLPVIGMLAVLISFVSLRISLLLYILMPAYYMWPRPVERFVKKAVWGE